MKPRIRPWLPVINLLTVNHEYKSMQPFRICLKSCALSSSVEGCTEIIINCVYKTIACAIVGSRLDNANQILTGISSRYINRL